MTLEETPIEELADALAHGGEAGSLIASHDWQATPLGPMEGWPERLKAAVAIVMRSPFPMHISWGSELVQLYNDAYRPVLGTKKHPAIGVGVSDTFAESFEGHIEPYFALALAGEPYFTYDTLLPLDRHGWLEETHFAYSYSPLDGDDGAVAGVLTQCMEITARVISERRLAALTGLSVAMSSATTPEEVMEVATAQLSTCPSVPWVLVVDTNDDEAVVAGHAGVVDVPVRLALSSEALRHASRGRRTVSVEWLGVETRASHDWPEPSLSGRVMAIGDQLLVLGLHPGVPADATYFEFQELVAASIAAAQDHATRQVEASAHLESLRQLDRAKDLLLSDVSHELRTPLTLIGGSLEEMAGADERDRAELVAMARRNVQRLTRLVDSLLVYGQLTSGVELPAAVADLASLTAHLCETFRPEFDRVGIELRTRIPTAPVAVRISRSAWESVVSNLVSNSLKFTLEGHVDVSVTESGASALLTVSDTGVGIASDELPQVFRRFYRSRNVVARTDEGAGIGLALVAGVAERHGGRVDVVSEVGVGSTFTVSLPLTTDEPPRVEDRAPTRSTPDSRVAGAADEPVGRGTALRPLVLVVDDHDDLRALITRVLSRSWRVETACNGAEALAAVRREPPAVVVTDLMMPVMDGFALLEAIRSDPALASTRTLVLTGIGEHAPVADAQLAKPFPIEVLQARVTELLARGDSRP